MAKPEEPTSNDNRAVVERYLDSLRRGLTPDALATFFAEDAVQEEFPNRFMPNGATSDLAAMHRAAERGLRNVTAQQYELLNIVDNGDRVALEIQWTGTLAVPVGSIPAGSQMRARLAVFLDFRDGKIVRQRNYDCYDPF